MIAYSNIQTIKTLLVKKISRKNRQRKTNQHISRSAFCENTKAKQNEKTVIVLGLKCFLIRIPSQEDSCIISSVIREGTGPDEILLIVHLQEYYGNFSASEIPFGKIKVLFKV